MGGLQSDTDSPRSHGRYYWVLFPTEGLALPAGVHRNHRSNRESFQEFIDLSIPSLLLWFV